MSMNKENVFVDVQRGELNDIQKKSSDDLWKEDLALFIQELDVSFVFASYCRLSKHFHFHSAVRSQWLFLSC